MQYDLALLCRDARERIEVPMVPLGAIRTASAAAAPRRAGWLTALIAGVAIVAVAVGAGVLGTRVIFDRSGNVELVLNSPKMTFKNPTSADVAAAVQRANFPVTLPAGLPTGSQLKSIWSSDGAIMLLYDLPGEWRVTHHVAWIVLANPDAVSSSGAFGNIRIRFAPVGKPIQWRVGGEDVIIAMPRVLTSAEIARMKAAMLAASSAK
jgi:hypothetical protein